MCEIVIALLFALVGGLITKIFDVVCREKEWWELEAEEMGISTSLYLMHLRVQASENIKRGRVGNNER